MGTARRWRWAELREYVAAPRSSLSLPPDQPSTEKKTQEHADEGNAQRSYLKTLSEEAKEDFDETPTQAQASVRIDELQHKTGRGTHGKSDAAEGSGVAKSDDRSGSRLHRSGMLQSGERACRSGN